MDEVVVIGVGMHRFGEHPHLRLPDLARVAVWAAIEDAGIDARAIDIAYVANCYAGVITGQSDAVAPAVLGYTGLSGLPMIHVSGGTSAATAAFHEAVMAVGSGQYRIGLALGVEKQFVPGNPARSISAINTSLEKVVAMDLGMTPLAELAMGLRRLMDGRGWTRADFARVTAKNRWHASMNPLAEVQQPISEAEVLAAPEVAWPLTRPMCASAGVDGAAAALVCTRRTARELGATAGPRVAAMHLRSTPYLRNDAPVRRTGVPSMDDVAEVFATVYSRAGVGPHDLELLQIHDAVAPEELLAYEVMGLCAPGEEAALLASGATRLGGRIPTGTDGGLLARGHPVGVTGLAQIHETVVQMRGRAGPRQAWHDGRPPRIAAVQNAGARGGAANGVPVCAGLIFQMDRP
ncbi:MAG: thiolase family protein [Gammaproteobacteria bacterium]